MEDVCDDWRSRIHYRFLTSIFLTCLIKHVYEHLSISLFSSWNLLLLWSLLSMDIPLHPFAHNWSSKETQRMQGKWRVQSSVVLHSLSLITGRRGGGRRKCWYKQWKLIDAPVCSGYTIRGPAAATDKNACVIGTPPPVICWSARNMGTSVTFVDNGILCNYTYMADDELSWHVGGGANVAFCSLLN